MKAAPLQPPFRTIPPSLEGGWWILPATTLAICTLVGIKHPEDTLSERGTIETSSVVLWVIGSISSGILAIRSRAAAAVVLVWMTVISLLCAARELDLQQWMNPSHIGDWGVRFRIDWFLDGAVPLSIKAFWAAVFAIKGAVFFVVVRQTLAAMKDRANRKDHLHWRSNPALKLFSLSLFLMFVGWGSDDILRGTMHPVWGALFEESIELLAAATFVSVPATFWLASRRVQTEAWESFDSNSSEERFVDGQRRVQLADENRERSSVSV